LVTKGFSKGTLRWNNFRITADSAKYSNGKIFIPNYPTPPQKITLTITPKHHPDKKIIQVLYLNRLTEIRMNPVINSTVSPGERFNLALDAIFNNGKTTNYPLLII
jgi:hypothetical protein